jgi:CheY-like chemotaxis protein
VIDAPLLSLLLVEDDDVAAEAVVRGLRKHASDCPVVPAEDGAAALHILRGEDEGHRIVKPYLVLLDLNMPRMNGIEFLRAIRADAELRSLPVVVLTTSNDERDKVDAYNLNVAGYLLKPVTFTDFVDLMAALNKYWMLVEMP